jgi:hypothetical protein
MAWIAQEATPKHEIDTTEDMESIPEHRVDVTEDIDISALLDPVTYFSRLENLEARILNGCKWQESADLENVDNTAAPPEIMTPRASLADMPDLELDSACAICNSGEDSDAASEKDVDDMEEVALVPMDIPQWKEKVVVIPATIHKTSDTNNALRYFTMRSHTAEISQIRDEAQIVCELEKTVAALYAMQNERFCRAAVSIVVDVTGRPDVVELVDISITDVEALLVGIGKALPLGLFPNQSLLLMARLLAKFGAIKQFGNHTGHHLPASTQDVLAWIDDDSGLISDAKLRYLDLLSALLSLATRSYAVSHCVKDDSQPFGASTTSVRLDHVAAHTAIQPNFNLRQRRLACLDSFLKSNLWVFGTTSSPLWNASLLCSVEQFADLWGPVFAVPSSPSRFQELLSLNLEGGILHRPPSTEHIVVQARAQSVSRGINETIYKMHFTPCGPLRRRRCDDATLSNMLSVSVQDEQSPLPELSPFPSSARMLIGQPNLSTESSMGIMDEVVTLGDLTRGPNASVGDDPEDAVITVAARDSKGTQALDETRALNEIRTLNETRMLSINLSCPLSMGDFGKANALDLHALGTAKACYLRDSYQINFNSGQWINLGVQKSWKLRPASTYKTMLVEMCTKPRMKQHIQSILDRRVGLEWSACTGNAERRTLWEALKRAFPADAATLDAAYAAKDNETIAEFVADLSLTGLDEQDHFRLVWPTHDGLPQVLVVSKRLPNWTKMLRDTQESACFAFTSRRCLVYQSTDAVAKRRVINGCRIGRPPHLKSPILATTINIHNDSQGPMQPRRLLRLNSGHLEIRSNPVMLRNRDTDLEGQPGAQLAYFTDNSHASFWQSELRNRLGSGRSRPISRELLHDNDASKQTVPLCIMDTNNNF